MPLTLSSRPCGEKCLRSESQKQIIVMCMGNVFALIHKGSAVRFLHVSGSGLSTCDARRFPARQLSSNVLPEGYLLLW
jgi:hypothetical protein